MVVMKYWIWIGIVTVPRREGSGAGLYTSMPSACPETSAYPMTGPATTGAYGTFAVLRPTDAPTRNPGSTSVTITMSTAMIRMARIATLRAIEPSESWREFMYHRSPVRIKILWLTQGKIRNQVRVSYRQNAVCGMERTRDLRIMKKTIEETAGLKGFEPLTYGLRVRRSAELSYKPRKFDLHKW